jgi:hypothetical protein
MTGHNRLKLRKWQTAPCGGRANRMHNFFTGESTRDGASSDHMSAAYASRYPNLDDIPRSTVARRNDRGTAKSPIRAGFAKIHRFSLKGRALGTLLIGVPKISRSIWGDRGDRIKKLPVGKSKMQHRPARESAGIVDE